MLTWGGGSPQLQPRSQHGRGEPVGGRPPASRVCGPFPQPPTLIHSDASLEEERSQGMGRGPGGHRASVWPGLELQPVQNLGIWIK